MSFDVAYDVERVRADFPILNREINGNQLVYLDSAASAQKPTQVINAMKHAMEHSYANVHRGLHTMANETTAIPLSLVNWSKSERGESVCRAYTPDREGSLIISTNSFIAHSTMSLNVR